MSRQTRYPALPAARTLDVAVKQALDGLREQAMRWRGDVGPVEGRVVTFGDLQEGGIGQINPGRRAGEPIVTPPDETQRDVGPLSNLQTAPVFELVVVSWSGTNQRYYSHTEIWRNTTDDLGTATLRGTSEPEVFGDTATPGQTYYYWVRAVSTSGDPGAFNATAGVKAVTQNRPEFLLDELTDQITESQLYGDLRNRLDNIEGNSAAIEQRSRVRVDGNEVSAQWDLRMQTTVDGQVVMGGFGLAADGDSVEAGFNVDRLWVGHPNVDYSQQGKRFPFIVDGGVVYIDEAMIRQAAIGSAQIADLAAEKINAGTVNVALTLTAAEITGGSLNINNRFMVDGNGNVTILSASTGARMEVKNDVIKVFDSNGTKRVQIGNLSA